MGWGRTRPSRSPRESSVWPVSALLNRPASCGTHLTPAMLSRVDFSELLLEVTAMTGMDGEISPVAGSMPHVDDLDVSLCALIVAEAGNVGLAHASWPPYSRQPTPRRSRWRRNLSAIS